MTRATARSSGDSPYTAAVAGPSTSTSDDGGTACAGCRRYVEEHHDHQRRRRPTAFNNLGPGTYIVCEDDGNTDWIQTFPNTVGR